MAGGSKFCNTDSWTPLYQGPSFGFVYVSSANLDPNFPIHIRWRAYSAGIPFYWSGDATIKGKTTVGFGLPTPYVQFEVQPDFPTFLFGS